MKPWEPCSQFLLTLKRSERETSSFSRHKAHSYQTSLFIKTSFNIFTASLHPAQWWKGDVDATRASFITLNMWHISWYSLNITFTALLSVSYLGLVYEEPYESWHQYRARHAALPPHLLLEEGEGSGRGLLGHGDRVGLPHAGHAALGAAGGRSRGPGGELFTRRSARAAPGVLWAALLRYRQAPWLLSFIHSSTVRPPDGPVAPPVERHCSRDWDREEPATITARGLELQTRRNGDKRLLCVQSPEQLRAR